MKLFYTICLTLLSTSIITAKEALDIKSVEEFKEILSQKKPVVILFYAPWCGACKAMKEPFDKAGEQLGDDATLIKVNATNEKLQEIADSFNIEVIPTIAIKHVGLLSADDLTKSVQSLIKKKSPTEKNKEQRPVGPEKKAPVKAAAKPAPKAPAPKKHPQGQQNKNNKAVAQKKTASHK